MAHRGKPLPWSMRERIGELRRATDPDTLRPFTIRYIADVLELSKTTVQFYANKFGTNSLPITIAST